LENIPLSMSENHVADFSSYIREKFCPMEMAPMSEKKLSDFASYTSVKMLHFNRDISKRTLAIPVLNDSTIGSTHGYG